MNHSQHAEEVRILLIAANPNSTRYLQLQEEIRTITEKIHASNYRDSLIISYALAAQPNDLIQALQRYQPHIVHISCHGCRTGKILLLDRDGQETLVSPEALKELFTALRGNIRLVFLNACYSQVQAEAITSVIDCAIGMSTSISDESAILFAASVYQSIGFGRSLQDAFDIGKVALSMENLSEHSIPQLMCRVGVDPSRIYLIDSGKPPSSVSNEISTSFPMVLAQSQTLFVHRPLNCNLYVNQPMKASVDSVMIQHELNRTLWYIRVKNTGSISLLYGMTFDLILPNSGTIRKTVFENYPFSPGDEKVFTVKLDRFVPFQIVNYPMFIHMIGESSRIYPTHGPDLSFDPMTFVFNS